MELQGTVVSELKLGVVINISSGGCDAKSDSEMLDIDGKE
jgi:hypothetical protein